jgi:DNA mismatch repair protein MutL
MSPTLSTISAPDIRVLPTLLVNQIAAGEVIERPASVVKELVDNAIDAKSSRITIDIESGGVELIRVSDNGHGIRADQLTLALAPHATSKIRSAEDLDRIGTLGFRGEALASIASVSRLSLRSRTAGDVGASRLDAEGDSISPIRPDAGPVGTSVTVRNLFFNTPARRKFLRTPATEQQHCVETASALAMSHPAIGFTLSVDGRVTLDLPPDQGPRDRALAVIGREMESQYLEVSIDQWDDARGIAMWGLVGTPNLARLTTKWQHVFLNGRPIRDKTIQHALKEAYRGLIEPGKHPAVVLMLAMDPGAVDVNVHPAKAEVRFRDSGLIHSAIQRSVREALQRADLTPAIGAASPPSSAPIFPLRPSTLASVIAPIGADPLIDTSKPTRDRFVDYFKRFVPSDTDGKTFDYEGLSAAVVAEREAVERERAALEAARAVPASPPDPALPAPVAAARILQVHQSYVVTQDEQGVVIIDQHALHERVMFEKLKSRLGEGELESQRLLMPAIVPATARQAEKLRAMDAVLRRLGLSIEPIGPQQLAVHSFPTFLFDRRVDAGPFVAELLERAESSEFPLEAEALIHEVLDMMACKAAVKAGDSLNETELAELLRMRDEVERSSNCPHGRPTAIRLSIKELERRFGRS